MAEVLLGAAQQGFEVVVIEPAQHEDLGARQQRADQLEGRVLGRRADEDHRAVLDNGQKGVLLGAVEAVDLVDEEQRALAHLAALPGRLEHLAQIGDPGENGRERLEDELGAVRQEARDRRLAAARRAPQDHRGELPARHHAPDRPLRAQQMILPDDVGEALRPQPVGQRVRRLFLEQAWSSRTVYMEATGCDIIRTKRPVARRARPPRNDVCEVRRTTIAGDAPIVVQAG